MGPLILLPVLFGALGLVLGPLVARLAAARTVAQPVGVKVDEERSTLAGVLSDPGGYVFVAELKSEDFLKPEHRALWSVIVAECEGVVVPGPTDKEEAFEAASVHVPGDLADRVLAVGGAAGDLARELLDEGVSMSRKELVKQGSEVFTAAADRGRFAGAGALVPGGPGEPLLVRRYAPPGKARVAFSSLLLGAVGAGAPFLATLTTSTFTTLVLTTLALFTLGVFSLVWALVDHDTMYLDYPTFWAGAGAAWILTVMVAGLEGDWSRLLSGVAMVVGTAVVFELGSFLYSKVRGEAGMGFGDSIIAVATAGVPAALTGNWMLGYYSVMAAMILSILGWVLLRIQGRVTRETPFAFGPYLALGWIAAYAAVASVGGL